MASALKNTFYYTIGSLVKATTSFLLLPLFANILGAEQYGILNLLQTFSSVLGVLMTFAIERSLFRLYYDYKTEDDRICFLSTVFWAITIISTAVVLMTIFTGGYIVSYLGNVDVVKVLQPTVLYTFIFALINYSQILMQVEQKGLMFLRVSILLLAAYNILSLIFLLYFSRTVESLVCANLAANLIVLPFAYKYIKKYIKFRFDYLKFKAIFKFSLPMFVAVVFSWVINMTDRFFIANLTNLSDAGIYSLASKFTQLAVLLCGAIFQSYGPMFYNFANSKPYKDACNKLMPLNRLVTLFVCLIYFLIVAFSKPILNIFFSAEYSHSIRFVYLLSLSGIFVQQTGLLNMMVYQNKQTSIMSVIGILAGLLSMVFNVIFIPLYGSIAAGYVNLLVGFIIFIISYLIAKRNFFIPFGFVILILSVFCIILCAVVDFILLENLSNIIVKTGLIVIYFFLLCKFKLIPVAELEPIWAKMKTKMLIQ